MEISSIPPFNTENNKERAKKYGAPAVMSAGAVMLATRAPKDTENPIKFSKRLTMSAKAGVATAKEVSNKEIENTEEKEMDKAITEAKNLAEPENPVPNVIEPNVQQEANFFMNNTKFPFPPAK